MNHSSSNYSRPGWRIKTDIYIFFISFSFFLMIFWILWLCIKQPNLVALQQLTLPDDILVWKMHQRLTVEGKKKLLITSAETQVQVPAPHSTVIQPNAPHSTVTFYYHPPFFLIVFIVPDFLCSSLWRMAAAVPPRRCISSGGWTAGACFNYVKAQLKTTQYESHINLQLHTIMLQSGLKRTWRCAFRTNVK